MKKWVLIFLIVLLCSSFAFCHYSKTPIHQATATQLISLYGIGDFLTEDILTYIEHNPTCTVDDLIDIKGIGPKKLSTIKDEFR